MSERENERNNPSQNQNTGFNQNENRDVTNSDRDRQPTNAANQQRNEHPQMGTQREGQRQDESRTNDPTRPGQNPQQAPGKTTPEVPGREETHERQTPRADQRNEDTDRNSQMGNNDRNTPQL